MSLPADYGPIRWLLVVVFVVNNIIVEIFLGGADTVGVVGISGIVFSALLEDLAKRLVDVYVLGRLVQINHVQILLEEELHRSWYFCCQGFPCVFGQYFRVSRLLGAAMPICRQH